MSEDEKEENLNTENSKDKNKNCFACDDNIIKNAVDDVINKKKNEDRKKQEEQFEKNGKNLYDSSRIVKTDLMFYSSQSIKIDKYNFYKIKGNNFS